MNATVAQVASWWIVAGWCGGGMDKKHGLDTAFKIQIPPNLRSNLAAILGNKCSLKSTAKIVKANIFYIWLNCKHGIARTNRV
jgi:hypothetical protein